MGYKHEQFTKKLDQNLRCPICHEIFKEPRTCNAGHTFCDECIKKWLESSRKCPADNTPLNKSSLVPNLTVKGIIDDLDVYCHPLDIDGNTELSPANKRIRLENSTNDEGEEQNCCWTGKLHELETHRKTCGFQLETCAYKNCKHEMKRKDLEKHKETCKYRRVVCKECASKLVERKLQKHLEKSCPNVMVPCPNNCSTDGEVTKIRRINLADHQSKMCPKALVDCPYKEQGCVVKVERQDVEKHVQENMAAHMMLLAKECSSLRKQNKSLTDQCSSLVCKNTEVKNELTDKNSQLVQDLSKVKEEFHNQLFGSFSYTWVVREYPSLSKMYPHGSGINSPTFWLRGYKLRFLLYPNGNTAANATGFLSLYLINIEDDSQAISSTMPTISSNESAVHFRLTVISQKPDTKDICGKHVFTETERNWGFPEFLKASDAVSPSYSKNGNLIIQCTILHR